MVTLKLGISFFGGNWLYVTAKYVGTVSRIALDRVRYVAVFEGTEVKPVISIPEPIEPDIVPDKTASDEGGFQFNWAWVLVPLGAVVLAGGGVGAALYLKRRNELDGSGDTQ